MENMMIDIKNHQFYQLNECKTRICTFWIHCIACFKVSSSENSYSVTKKPLLTVLSVSVPCNFATTTKVNIWH